MSEFVNELAQKLAKDALDYVDLSGDEDLIRDMKQSIADRSQTFEEAFVIALRVIEAERYARDILDNRTRMLSAPKATLEERAAAALARRRASERS